ncbi:hypothetical protein F1609_33520 [Massilia sp. CCM 8693]|uniref:Transposase n=2 Tax=Massilia aquatica TaxID=2609000 RepID=A0ABX0MF66_9BURK|nr:hypothetical protein [Massilia aquatica]
MSSAFLLPCITPQMVDFPPIEVSEQIRPQQYAPYGFEGLETGIVYHFLFNDKVLNRVVLVTFSAPIEVDASLLRTEGVDKSPPLLAFVRRDRFEYAILSSLLLPCTNPRELPHWLDSLSISDLLAHDRSDVLRKVSHAQRIDQMLAHLWPALERLLDILRAANPVVELNRLARACLPPQNETRFRIAFFAYVSFGMERLALHYAIPNIGKWDRSKKEKKFGRPSSLGAMHGHSSCAEEFQENCRAGYSRFSGPGVSMRSIYRQTMTIVFGCKAVKDSRLRMRFAHPDGKPFPTQRQFEYRVAQTNDLSTRQLMKYGAARVRSKLRPSQGQFTAAVANAMEILVEDAYFVKEVAQGYLEGSHLPRLAVVRIICLASGMIVGIGFSLKGEQAEAYRMAKGCMAVDKVWFCSLYGITINSNEWPSTGLPLHEITDRGPGATSGAEPCDQALRPVIREIAPSYSGQSKANVETRHPKEVKLEGAPQYQVTRLSIPQLAQREIWKVIESNLTTNVQPRLTPDAICAGVLPTPVTLWNYLSELGRTFAFRIPREQAIRAYFTKIDLTIDDGAVFYMGLRFWSHHLRDSSVLRGGCRPTQGYMLPTCVRQIFLETPDGLITVDAAYGIRTDDEEYFLSAAELEQLAKLRSEEQASLRVHREAAKADVSERFTAETGMPYEQIERKPGRAKRGNFASLEEARQTMPLLRPKGGRK